jgi:hypothetical protein
MRNARAKRVPIDVTLEENVDHLSRAALWVSLLLLSTAGPSLALPIDLAETSVSVFVTDLNTPAKSDADTALTFTSSFASDTSTGDEAEGRARVAPGGIGAKSSYVGASGSAPFRVTSQARQIRSFTTEGLDPGIAIPLNFSLGIDGQLGVATGSRVGADQLQAGVNAFIRIDNGTELEVVQGSAALRSTGAQFEFALNSDFSGLSVATDVVPDPTGSFGNLDAVVTFNDTIEKPNSASVGFGSVFTIEMVLSTFVFVDVTETVIFSDFIDTAVLDLQIGTDPNGQTIPGVRVVELPPSSQPPGTPVPEPSSLWLTLLGIGFLWRAKATGRLTLLGIGFLWRAKATGRG